MIATPDDAQTYMGFTAVDFRLLFAYVDGRLFWKAGRNAGREAGCDKGNGRWVVRIGNKKLYRSVVVFMLWHGYRPQMVDHIDRNPLNDRLGNLRPATRSQNARNAAYSNKTGFKGVSLDRNTGRWRSFIYLGKRSHYLGLFSTPEEAAEAHDREARRRFGQHAFQNFSKAA